MLTIASNISTTRAFKRLNFACFVGPFHAMPLSRQSRSVTPGVCARLWPCPCVSCLGPVPPGQCVTAHFAQLVFDCTFNICFFTESSSRSSPLRRAHIKRSPSLRRPRCAGGGLRPSASLPPPLPPTLRWFHVCGLRTINTRALKTLRLAAPSHAPRHAPPAPPAREIGILNCSREMCFLRK